MTAKSQPITLAAELAANEPLLRSSRPVVGPTAGTWGLRFDFAYNTLLIWDGLTVAFVHSGPELTQDLLVKACRDRGVTQVMRRRATIKDEHELVWMPEEVV